MSKGKPNKKSYADLANKIKKKYEGYEHDPIAKKAMLRKLEELAARQEQHKQALGIVPESEPEMAWGGALSGGLSGAGTGASIGTSIAPGIGTAIGAGVGLLGGMVSGHLNEKKEEERYNEQLKLQQQSIKANERANMPRNIANSEMYAQPMPGFGYGGSLIKQYGGPTHEGNPQGGIPIDENGNVAMLSNNKPTASVEGGEASAGGFVFSDRLSPDDTIKKMNSDARNNLRNSMDAETVPSGVKAGKRGSNVTSPVRTPINNNLREMMNSKDSRYPKSTGEAPPKHHDLSIPTIAAYGGNIKKMQDGGILPTDPVIVDKSPTNKKITKVLSKNFVPISERTFNNQVASNNAFTPEELEAIRTREDGNDYANALLREKYNVDDQTVPYVFKDGKVYQNAGRINSKEVNYKEDGTKKALNRNSSTRMYDYSKPLDEQINKLSETFLLDNKPKDGLKKMALAGDIPPELTNPAYNSPGYPGAIPFIEGPTLPTTPITGNLAPNSFIKAPVRSNNRILQEMQSSAMYGNPPNSGTEGAAPQNGLDKFTSWANSNKGTLRDLSSLAVSTGQNLSDIRNARALPVNYARVNPNTVDYSAQRDAIQRQADLAKSQGRQDASSSSRTRGELMARLQGVQTGVDRNSGAAIGQSLMQEQTTNAQILNNVQAQNAQIQMQEATDREREYSSAQAQRRGARQNIANQFRGMMSDQGKREAESQAMDALMMGNPDVQPFTVNGERVFGTSVAPGLFKVPTKNGVKYMDSDGNIVNEAKAKETRDKYLAEQFKQNNTPVIDRDYIRGATNTVIPDFTNGSVDATARNMWRNR